MGTEEAWFLELTVYCVVLIVPILSLFIAVYGIQQIVTRHRTFYKLVGLLLVLIGILGGILTIMYILPIAADGLSALQQHTRPSVATPVNPFTGD